MKRYVNSSEDVEYSYIPESFESDEDSVDEILNQLHEEITKKFGKKYKNLSVDIDDVRWKPTRLIADVFVYNNDVLKAKGEFDFMAYSEYEDISDYYSHVSRTISKFVNNLYK